jgi:EAL domain-containing protein (putative c-di-GMP-specific phosphodiesterase class I)/GGDEF domain-containing protein
MLLLIPGMLPVNALLLLSPVPGGIVSFLSLGILGGLSFSAAAGRFDIYYKPVYGTIIFASAVVVTAILFFTYLSFRKIARVLLGRSYQDPISGLPNRYKLLDDIRRSGTPALALVKAERFNEINSCFGYHFGERYLMNIKMIIEKILEQTLSIANLYHVDKDTFAILEEKDRFDSNNDKLNDRFSDIIRLLRDRTFAIDGLRFPVPVTAGISVGSSKDPVLLFNQAELALTAAIYSSKSKMYFEDSQYVKDDIVSHTKTLALVSHAINSDTVEVEFQPIVTSKKMEIVMFEALVRIKDDAGRLLPPGSFLFTAKLSSYHKELTRIVFQKTFKRMGKSGPLFTVNISMENIVDEDFLPFLKELMEEHPVCKNRCVLEITESEGVENYDEVCTFITAVRTLGYKIAIDDFGSGYSNFANIMRLSVDYIKFDGTLIQRMKDDGKAVTVLRKMNEIAHEIDVSTIAEFIDSEELLAIVRKIKIDHCQGFLIGRPSSRLVTKIKR